MPAITLEQLLKNKEERQARRQSLCALTQLTVVVITLNMPGPIKDGAVLRRLRDYAVAEVNQRLLAEQTWSLNAMTGPEALVAVKNQPQQAKEIAVQIEEEQIFGRLLDIDVYSAEGEQMTRNDSRTKRTCLVCGQPALACMREKRHSLEQVLQEVKRRLASFCAWETACLSSAAQQLGQLAVEAMLYEVTCTPAPGLVDRNNQGAHDDMDFYTFMASSAALANTMDRCAQAGLRWSGPADELLPVLRLIGQAGETSMFAATNGVNTQKGILFTLGIVVAAAGMLLQQGTKEPEALFEQVAAIASGLVEKELISCDNTPSVGQALYRLYGLTGIRGELEGGLPSIRHYGLPELKRALSSGLSLNDSLVQTLLVLMTCVEDTNVAQRHNPTKLIHWLRPQVRAILARDGVAEPKGLEQVLELDKKCIEHHVSPGGSADLLAVTWFIYRFSQTDW